MPKVKPEYKIENWSMGSPEKQDPFRAPETYSMHLFGNIEGHPTCTPGKMHITSKVKAIDLENRRVETRNSIYKLGKIDAKYLVDAIVRSKSPKTVEILTTVYEPELRS